jgi:hypothetical protein
LSQEPLLLLAPLEQERFGMVEEGVAGICNAGSFLLAGSFLRVS